MQLTGVEQKGNLVLNNVGLSGSQCKKGSTIHISTVLLMPVIL